jgi:hypothetical protein
MMLMIQPGVCSRSDAYGQMNAQPETSLSHLPQTVATVTDHATLLGLLASTVFSTFTLISLGLASAFFARRIFSTPFS